jgi:2-phosphosulfolactate phosphatase
LKGKVVVVIDILRATTTMCYALMNGAEGIIPVETVEEARQYLTGDHIVAAERNGLPAEGFTLGNSPESFSKELVNGKTVVITTTNGTYTLHQCLKADKILMGSFANISALCNWLVGWDKPVVLVCAGWKNKFNLEDTVFAGAVLFTIKPYFNLESDSCIAALNLFLTAAPDMEAYLRNCNHAQRFERLGINDLPVCLDADVTDIVPVYSAGILVPLTAP